MDPKIFRARLEEIAVVVQHADALTADKRRVLQEREDQPLIAVKIRDRPCVCMDCGLTLANSPVRNHERRNRGWRSHCTGCNRVRQPGTDYFGQSPDAEPKRNRLGPRPELLPPPSQPQQQDCQSSTTASDPSEPVVVGYVEQVVEREYPESVIKEYSRTPIFAQPGESCAPVADNEVRKD